mmetsp:Transcript_9200/g.20774  ORF Transcript_9200/g.20774 Transcript_9200/m.20774 type:complete len:669 (-) Transcript_9200:437-2443(-)
MAMERYNEEELADFFENAPIAMHWLSGEGLVLSANQTELRMLGYTAEEYIGQPMMNYCPDDKELVTEIFKQLGGGNTLKDVPMRFRAKDGRSLDLLLNACALRDSETGAVVRSRWCLSDDSQRRVREARDSLLLEETKRSMKQLERLATKTLRHTAAPLEVVARTCEHVSDMLDQHASTGAAYPPAQTSKVLAECVDLLDGANSTASSSMATLCDVGDLIMLDQGASTLSVSEERIDLKQLGLLAMQSIAAHTKPGVELGLEMGTGGPALVTSDAAILKRAIAHLLTNAAKAAPANGKVALSITYPPPARRCTFTVADNGPGLPTLTQSSTNSSSSSNLSALASSSSSAAAESQAVALASSGSMRSSRLGRGGAAEANEAKAMPEALPPMTFFERFGQSMSPASSLSDQDDNKSDDASNDKGLRELIERGNAALAARRGLGVGLSLTYHLVQVLGSELRFSSNPGDTKFWFQLPESATRPEQMKSERLVLDATCNKLKPANKRRAGGTGGGASKRLLKAAALSKAERVAAQGLEAVATPLVLVVDDTALCVKLLCTTLRRLGCSTESAENGQVAVEFLRRAVPGMYALVLMDLRMPVMDGFQATKTIREDLGLLQVGFTCYYLVQYLRTAANVVCWEGSLSFVVELFASFTFSRRFHLAFSLFFINII